MTPADDHAPVSPADFAATMDRLASYPADSRMALALSGGGDSMALALLLRDWAHLKNIPLIALTVDHGLRSGSRAEAESTAAFCAAQGIPHQILSWEGDKPASRVQESARRARYALLLEACRRSGARTLALAHNLEDQAETFWMRLSHASGLDGLTGIPEVREEGGVSVIRPVLDCPRARLRATCRAHGVQWLEDPSNTNDRFLRARLRKFEDLLATEGFSAHRLAQTMRKLSRAHAALEQVTDRAMSDCFDLRPGGFGLLDIALWRAQPEDIRQRLIVRALRSIAPSSGYPPGADAVDQLAHDIAAPGFSGRTLAGCEVFPASITHLCVSREAAAQQGRIRVAPGVVWDGRFIVDTMIGGGLDIGALGDEGFDWLRKNGFSLPALSLIPFRTRKVLPTLWREDALISIPHLGWYAPGAPDVAYRLRIRPVV